MMYLPDTSDEDYDDYDDYDYFDPFCDGYDTPYSEDEDSVHDMFKPKKDYKVENHVAHCAKMLEGLNTDRRSEVEMCDGTIVVDGKEFRVHRMVLRAASSYFRAMFTGSFNESQKKRVEIKDVNKEPFEVVLNYIYGEMDQITEENLLEVYECADMLCVDCVLDECKGYLNHNCLQMKDKIAAYFLANRMGLEDTTKSLMAYFDKEFSKFAEEPQFCEMPNEVIQEVVEKKLANSSCHVDMVVEAITSLVSHAPESRISVVEKILPQIHLDQVTNSKMDALTQALSIVTIEDKDSAERRDALVSKIQSNSKMVRQKLTDLKLKIHVCMDSRKIEIREFHHNTWDWTEHATGVDVTNAAVNLMDKFLNGTVKIDIPGIREAKSEFSIDSLQAVAMLKNEVFLFGTQTVLAYDVAKRKTREIQQLPKARTKFSAVAYDNSIFVVGGNLQEVLRYDFFANKWTVISSWFNPKSSTGVIIHIGVMYMLGGYDAKTSTSNYFMSYNMVCRRFARLPNMPRHMQNSRIAAFGNCLYVFGMELVEADDFISVMFKLKEFAFCQIYNIKKKTWSDSKVKISCRENILDVKSTWEGLLVFKSQKEGDTTKFIVSLYKPELDTLEYVACLPSPKENSALLDSRHFYVDLS